MREKYEWMLNRWEELEQALAQPEVAADPERWQQLSRERTELEDRVTAWKRYLELQRMEAEARELEHDPELAEDARQHQRPGDVQAVRQLQGDAEALLLEP